MHKLLLLLLIQGFDNCKRQNGGRRELVNRIDSLEKKLANFYEPGFGEFMSSIQEHHSKLWFAGQEQNWKLADFEVHEIMEAIDDIKNYETERKESQLIGMIRPAIDSVNHAIQQKSPARFRDYFMLHTGTCNKCYQAANFAFNVVKTPETSQFSNQEFKVNDPK